MSVGHPDPQPTLTAGSRDKDPVLGSLIRSAKAWPCALGEAAKWAPTATADFPADREDLQEGPALHTQP